MAKVNLEVGKTYETRDGRAIKITGRSEEFGGTYRFIGEDEAGRLTWRSRRGRFDRRPTKHDLVREVAT